jgi:phospholipid/cholesterol/gamma-HCH transport system permease protein
MKSGKWIVFLEEVGAIGNFAGRFFREGLKPRYEWQELFRQCYIIGYKSLPLVGITAAIMGLVLTVQSRPTLAEFGAESWLPAMVAVSVVREIGPVITALICAGKIGSSIGAELGSMKVTEQIDAMEVSGTNPFKYLVVTRVMATTLMLPVLVIIADLLALYASYLGVNIKDAVSFKLYINQVFDALSLQRFCSCLCQILFFWICNWNCGLLQGLSSL